MNLFIFNPSKIFGQKNTDIQLRLTPSIEYKFNKKFKVIGEFRYALGNDMQTFRNSYLQLEGKYSLTKRIDLSGGYRFTTSYTKDAHRFFAALEYQYKINKQFRVASTSKYQFTTNSFDLDFINEYKEPKQYLRQKIALNYNVPKSKFSFKAGAEVFVEIEDNPTLQYNRMRYSLGTDYKFKNLGELGFSVFYENLYNPTKDNRIVFTTSYSVALNDLKKDKNKKDKKNKKENKAENN